MVFNTMSEALIAGDRIEVRGFGSFVVKNYEGYTGRNPKTGENIEITPRKVVTFKPSMIFKDFVDKGKEEQQ